MITPAAHPYHTSGLISLGGLYNAIKNSVITLCILIYPHTGVLRTPVGYSRAYMSAHISVRTYVSMSSRPHRCLEMIRAACNCAQRMWLQATG